MFGLPTHFAVFASATSLLFSSLATASQDSHTLPIFFFHGLTANATYGDNLKANLSTDARPFVSLSFCQDACSSTDLNVQAEMAIAQIKEYIAKDRRFDNGYTFIGHSQGGALARLVIETMDDHNVHTFVSLAGAGNGVFYGPQANDFVPAQVFLTKFAPLTDKKIYDYSNYTDADIRSGKLTIDMIKFQSANPKYASQLTRSPVKSDWIRYNKLFPKLNNLALPINDSVIADITRRKNNFLKLKEAHYFASQYDETISPWQSALNGQYEDVASIAELEQNYSKLKVLPMEQTPEYVNDLYGLKTLNERGGLFLHQVENVSHECWVKDFVSPRDGKQCVWATHYADNLFQLLKPEDASIPAKPFC